MLKQPYLLVCSSFICLRQRSVSPDTALAVAEKIDENRIGEISSLLSEKPAGFGLPVDVRRPGNVWLKKNLSKE
jgi:hypothetical protein